MAPWLSETICSSQKKYDSADMLYELVMQFVEVDPNGSISNAIVEWKNLQTEKLITQGSITEEFAKKQLDLIKEIVTDAEKSLIHILFWEKIKKWGHLVSFPLTEDNKVKLRVILRQISILYAYRNDANLDCAKKDIEKLTSPDDTSNTILNLELLENGKKIRRIYFSYYPTDSSDVLEKRK